MPQRFAAIHNPPLNHFNSERHFGSSATWNLNRAAVPNANPACAQNKGQAETF